MNIRCTFLVGSMTVILLLFSYFTYAKFISVVQEEQFKDLITRKKPLILKFSADYCPHCKITKEPFQEVANEPEFGEIEFAEIDVGSSEGNTIAQQFNVSCIPTFVYIRDGKEVDHIMGPENARSFKETLKTKLRQNFGQTIAPAQIEEKIATGRKIQLEEMDIEVKEKLARPKSKEKMKKALTIGSVTEDLFLLYKNIEMLHLTTEFEKRSFIILEGGRKIEVDNLGYYTGGGATNSAVSFKRLGLEVETLFKIGTDREGEFVVENLKKFDINLDYIVKDPTQATAISFIIPTECGDRTVLVFHGANKFIQQHEIPRNALDRADLVYITALSGESSTVLPFITKLAKQHQCVVAVNPGTSQLRAGADNIREALSSIDIFILNSYEARFCMASLVQADRELQRTLLEVEPFKTKTVLPELLRSILIHKGICFSLQHYFKAILNYGPQIAVVTNGDEGVYVATKNEIIFHPSIPVNVVNTLGAGDAFGSCFVASLAQGMSLENALRAGILNSASVIQYLDTKTGLLTKEQLAKQLTQLDTNLIRQFPL